MRTKSPESQVAAFIATFTPETAALIKAVRAKMPKRLPRAVEIVCNNSNFLVFGFGPTDRPAEAILSIAADARGAGLGFLRGAGLPDPDRRRRGAGRKVRNVKLPTAGILDEPAVQRRNATAIDHAGVRFDAAVGRRLISKTVSARQRPRRPSARRSTRI